MQMPEKVAQLIRRLEKNGYTAYAVGGCVRDTLRGVAPNDWDICTSATPGEMKTVFQGERTVETGLKHGTLTVVLDHDPYEITTYRVDGEYTDHRHPEQVSFVSDIREDLSRRDFTVNAMACGADGQIVDLFGGQADLSAGIIRCVGNAEKRFDEDALRVLRALRFASVLDFAIEEETDAAIRNLYPTLAQVAAERKREELVKLLCGKAAGRILRAYPEVISFLIPSLKPCIGYDQENPHHLFTVWEHTIRAVENIAPDPTLRMTMLLHDAGKPSARVTDAQGIGHYPGHQKISAELAEQTLTAFRFDRATEERIIRLVAAHDIPLSTERKMLLHRLNQFGESDLRRLFQIHRADRIATGTRNPQHAQEHYEELCVALDALLAERPCFTLKDLAINGNDLLSLGVRGKAVGELLKALLEKVMNGDVKNRRETLLELAREEVSENK